MIDRSFIEFWRRQKEQIRRGGWPVLIRKVWKAMIAFAKLPASIIGVLIIRMIRPWLLVRIGGLYSSRIGHFAANTELYLCERDAGINVPKRPYVDLWYHEYDPICNKQLARMWERILHVWPRWLLGSISRINSYIPGGDINQIGTNTQQDRDVHNLIERFSPHLNFLPEEENRGEAGLRALGIKEGAPFACLIVRDSAYLNTLNSGGDNSYHDYRNNDIENYVLAAEELCNRGYYVVRMGAIVEKAINSKHPMIIDYAINGTRSDFMDIYLGAKCKFCIAGGAGFAAVPSIFRRPIVLTNVIPVGYLASYTAKSIFIPKKHWIVRENRYMSFREIFDSGIGFCLESSGYEANGIKLIENSPQEIKAVVFEMVEMLSGTWQPDEKDQALHLRFRSIFPKDARSVYNSERLHGEIRSHIGAEFLRQNEELLE